MVVRNATTADAAAIGHVRAQTWKHAYAHIFPAEALGEVGPETGLDWWRRALAEPYPRMHTLVVESGGSVVGFANLGAAREDDDAGLGELFSIYVLPESWGLGAGRALMTETLARLQAEGFTEAILWVLEDNERTRRFYERAGWHTDGAAKDEEWLGTSVREVRYRIALGPRAAPRSS